MFCVRLVPGCFGCFISYDHSFEISKSPTKLGNPIISKRIVLLEIASFSPFGKPYFSIAGAIAPVQILNIFRYDCLDVVV